MRFERTTYRLGGGRSILLSYADTFFHMTKINDNTSPQHCNYITNVILSQIYSVAFLMPIFDATGNEAEARNKKDHDDQRAGQACFLSRVISPFFTHPILTNSILMSGHKTAGRTKHTAMSPIQSNAVIEAFTPLATSLVQPA